MPPGSGASARLRQCWRRPTAKNDESDLSTQNLLPLETTSTTQRPSSRRQTLSENRSNQYRTRSSRSCLSPCHPVTLSPFHPVTLAPCDTTLFPPLPPSHTP